MGDKREEGRCQKSPKIGKDIYGRPHSTLLALSFTKMYAISHKKVKLAVHLMIIFT